LKFRKEPAVRKYSSGEELRVEKREFPSQMGPAGGASNKFLSQL
jgi:hypothetical protein